MLPIHSHCFRKTTAAFREPLGREKQLLFSENHYSFPMQQHRFQQTSNDSENPCFRQIFFDSVKTSKAFNEHPSTEKHCLRPINSRFQRKPTFPPNILEAENQKTTTSSQNHCFQPKPLFPAEKRSFRPRDNCHRQTTSASDKQLLPAKRVGDAVVGRGNAGRTASKSGHPCPCKNCPQWPAETTGRGSLLNRPSCPLRGPSRSRD